MSTIATHSHWPLGPALLAGAVLSAICISPGSTLAQPDSPQAETQAAAVVPHHRHWIQVGHTSWYGRPFQGQATASGELFDMNSMTCAHRSLPLGALGPGNKFAQPSVGGVAGDDRGPVPESRVIDLSYGAAKILGFRGLAPVRLELVDTTLKPNSRLPSSVGPRNFRDDPPRFSLQLGIVLSTIPLSRKDRGSPGGATDRRSGFSGCPCRACPGGSVGGSGAMVQDRPGALHCRGQLSGRRASAARLLDIS